MNNDNASPEGNQLLAALPPAERALLVSRLEPVELCVGTLLHESGSPLRNVYFPTTAIVSLFSSMKDGASAEAAVVGNEGVVGVCAFMGGGNAHSSAVVQGAGHGYRIGAQAISEHARRSDAVMQPMLRYTQALLTQMAQTAACNRHHSLIQQVCRWLLLNLDRSEGNVMMVTQERISNMLGVRREGVTGAAFELQKAGLIQYARGRIAILDRIGLEARACECYSIVRKAYDRLQSNNGQRPCHTAAGTSMSAVQNHDGERNRRHEQRRTTDAPQQMQRIAENASIA